LTVAACVHHFKWASNDWNRWAFATVAGHLIECGTQTTGGLSTDWLTLDNPANIGFPIVEMNEDGTFVVTKPEGTGGSVTTNTVAEQLVYEIGDPGRYLSPDLTVSFLNLKLEQAGTGRVRVTGAVGSPPPSTYKVSATYRDGFRAAGQLTIFGRDAVKKARRCGEIVLEQMRAAGFNWRDSVIECIGAGACADGVFPASEFDSLKEVVMRVAIEAEDRDVVDYFTRQIIPLVTAGPQGTTGYAEGRPRVHPIFRYWPCLIDRMHVTPKVQFVEVPVGQSSEVSATSSSSSTPSVKTPTFGKAEDRTNQGADAPRSLVSNSPVARLGDVAIARSGDKGASANIGIVCRDPSDYSTMVQWLTPERVSQFLAPIGIKRIERFELPNLHGMNFIVHGVLSKGLRCDAQGKALGQVLLEMPLEGFSPTRRRP
jgi:hypothetical protein